MSRNISDAPLFSHPVKVGQLSHNPVELHLEADEDERRALAKLWRVVGVELLSADLRLRRWKKDGVKVVGHLSATVIQSCVVTLDPVESHIEEEIEQTYVPEGSLLARIPANDQGELIIDPEGPDLPETFTGDTIDVGSIVAEFAALGLDPYPRKPGATFEDGDEAASDSPRRPSPFAILRNLDDKK